MSDDHVLAGPAFHRQQNMRDAGVFNRQDAMPMRPSPIDPAWIRSGRPVTRCADHSDALDTFAYTVVWDCTRSTFDWHFDSDETIYIVEGSVRVTDALGQTHTLNAGSIGYFPAHTTWLWEVDHYVRKVAFLRREVPFGLRFVTRLLTRLDLDGRVLRRLRAMRVARQESREPRKRMRPSTAALVLMSFAL